MTDYKNKIAQEILEEREEIERQKIAPPPINDTPVKMAKFIWVGGVLLLDVFSAYIIYLRIAAYYAIIWLLVGAGGLLYSEAQRERIGNNDIQQSIGQAGVYVSAAAVFLMGLFAGYIYLYPASNPVWLSFSIELATVSLFAYHLVQAYRYHINDDEFIAQNEEARLEKAQQRKLRAAHRAARRVAAKAQKIDVEEQYRQKWGPAYDAALGLDVQQAQLRPVARPPMPVARPQTPVARPANPSMPRPPMETGEEDDE